MTKPLNQEEGEGANSYVMKVDPVLDDVEAKEDDASKKDYYASEEDSASEEDNVEEVGASDEDSASEEDIALMLGGMKAQIEDDALVLGVKKHYQSKVDTDLATRFNKRLREGTIFAKELEKYVADIKAKDKAFIDRIGRKVIEHLNPFLAETIGVRMKDVSGEDVAEINAYEEAFVVSTARAIVKHLTPCLAEILEECRP